MSPPEARSMTVAVRRLELPLAIGVLALVVPLAYLEMAPAQGFDFRPMYEAGRAVLEGRPVYDVPLFGYPPFAAVAFAPLGLLTWPVAVQLYGAVQICVAVAASALLGATLFPRHRLLAGTLVTLALLASQFFWTSVHLDNVSLLVLLPLVVVARLWGRSRWVAGAVVLAVSVAVKPLLALVFLVVVARRRLGALVVGGATVLVLTLAGVAVSHDVDGLLDLPRRVILGASQLGDVQIYNVSPNSIGIVHPEWATAMTVLRVILAVGVVVTVWRVRRWSPSFEGMLVLSGVLALTVPLVGTLSEVHYGVLAFPVAVAMVTGRLGRTAQVVAILGSIPLAIVFHGLDDHGSAQIQLCVAQVTILLATFLTHRPRPDDLVGGHATGQLGDDRVGDARNPSSSSPVRRGAEQPL